jgi:exopolysaccharide biosynthesis protein
MKRALVLLLLLVTASAHAGWQRVSPGVDYQRIKRGTIDAHVARIDLRNARLRVIASDESDHGLTVSEFAKKKKAIIAVNGDYFDERQMPLGMSAGACGVWTKGQKLERRQGLVGVGRRRAEIQQNTMTKKRWMSGAVSGWPLLNKGCAPLAALPGSDHFTLAPHPRTAAGLSKDGKTMYLVVADGRRDGVPGLTLPELAAFMDELGACVAMNLDGGGSSAMWVDVDGDQPRELNGVIVNQVSDGFERNVGNHLAVVASRDYEGCTK